MTTHANQQLNQQPNQQPKHQNYDAVIVGGRAAGASTAMLLARAGLRVLVVDRQAYGSDTLSSHALMRGAVRRLADWGLLNEVMDKTPAITRTVFNYGDEALTLEIKPEAGINGLAAPRRTVLDPILVDAAVAAGAEVLHNTKMAGLTFDDSGRVRGINLTLADGTERAVQADLVIGADGLRSSVARQVGAPITQQGQHASASILRYYTGFSVSNADGAGGAGDIDLGAYRWMYRPDIGGGLIPTSGNAVCVFTSMPQQRFKAEAPGDVVGTHLRVANELDPALAEALNQATAIGPVRSFPGVPGQFRKPFGPGWALVGDAGYFKDPYAAHGITDAFRDAELLTKAIVTDNFAGYETTRNDVSMPLFEILDRIASYEWDLDSLKGLHYGLSKAMKAEDEKTDRTLIDVTSELSLAA